MTETIAAIEFFKGSFGEIGSEVFNGSPIALIEVNKSVVNREADPQSVIDKFVFGEVPTGLINGSNATFTATDQFIPESLVVKVNGITQKLTNDYTVSGGLTISFLVSPVVGDSILIDYIKV
jgi:hypothetical protein